MHGTDRTAVLLAEIESVEVVGIAEQSKTSREVEYIDNYKVSTPFGRILLGSANHTEKGRVALKLFDDGWRLQQE